MEFRESVRSQMGIWERAAAGGDWGSSRVGDLDLDLDLDLDFDLDFDLDLDLDLGLDLGLDCDRDRDRDSDFLGG